LNKKGAQKQKDQETTASRKPLFHQKGLINKNARQNPKQPPKPLASPAAMPGLRFINSSNFLLTGRLAYCQYDQAGQKHRGPFGHGRPAG
jgi:hypothetical protein